jgi:hypothetical protein
LFFVVISHEIKANEQPRKASKQASEVPQIKTKQASEANKIKQSKQASVTS